VTKRNDAFSDIAASLDYPMWIVTTASAAERSGCLVGFATQCSIDPPRFAVWVSKANHTFPVAEHASTFAVHALRASDMDVARVFGEKTGDEVDKFSLCEWDEGPNGVPVLRGVDWFAGTVFDRDDTGDHVGYVLDIIDAGRADHTDERVFGFQQAKQFDAGHPA
jgi:flavin reductase (DIM6/NTAB) family NADH-FMN oxidoreductase RutF